MHGNRNFQKLILIIGIILSGSVQAADRGIVQDSLLEKIVQLHKPGLSLDKFHFYKMQGGENSKFIDIDLIFVHQEKHSSLKRQKFLDNSYDSWTQGVAEIVNFHSSDPVKINQLQQLLSLNVQYKWQGDQRSFFFLSELIEQPTTLSFEIIQMLAKARLETIEAKERFEENMKQKEETFNSHAELLNLLGY